MKQAQKAKGIYIFGCCMLSNGRMAFTHYTESVVRVFSNNRAQDFEVKISCNAFDILNNSEDNTLVVKSGDSMQHLHYRYYSEETNKKNNFIYFV